MFGIGYKTLPYSDYIGQGTVADNMYLSLLFETGIVGLAAFALLNARILQSSLEAARSSSVRRPSWKPGSSVSGLANWSRCFPATC